ncbi:MAG TPA: pitrilysin family protein [Thermoanaerobaculia bacterium]
MSRDPRAPAPCLARLPTAWRKRESRPRRPAISTYPRFHTLLALLLAGSLAAGCATVDRATIDDKPAVRDEPAETGEPTETKVSAVAPDAAPDSSYLDEAPLDASLPLAPDLVKGELDNGLTYYVRTNRRPEKRAELRLFVRAGSLQEDDDQQGLAHFVEHMAFNGTARFEKQEIVDYLESIGMRFGPDINAYTSFDETVYMLTVPTDDDEILGRAFDILKDWAHGIAFEDEEIDKERGVVVEEWRLGRGAAARIRDQLFPILFKGSRYAERLPIGEKEILENAPYDAFKRFYRDWYRPDLMAVVAVGDFDPGRVEELIHEHFSGLEGPPEPRPREIYPVPGHEETLWSFTTDPEIPTPRSRCSTSCRCPARAGAAGFCGTNPQLVTKRRGSATTIFHKGRLRRPAAARRREVTRSGAWRRKAKRPRAARSPELRARACGRREGDRRAGAWRRELRHGGARRRRGGDRRIGTRG